MAFTGLITTAGGVLHNVEILGPATLEEWKECYDVLFTGLIMLDCVRRPALANYRAHIIKLHQQFGPRCWALLYQADSRCRAENMDRLRYQLLAKHNAALASGQPTSFDSTRPWDSVWQAAVEDKEFWNEEFERHAIMVVTNSIPLNATLGTDATVLPSTSATPAASSGQPKNPGAQPKAKAEAKGLCRNYNAGSCLGASCSKGYGKHACSICGSPKHGAFQCPRLNKGQPAQEDGSSKGKKRQWGNGNRNGKKRKN